MLWLYGCGKEKLVIALVKKTMISEGGILKYGYCEV